MKKSILYLIILLVLSGFSVNNQINENGFKSNLEKMNIIVTQKKWKEANKTMQELTQIYHEEKWKLQLLGNEDEYNGIAKELKLLQTSIDVQDKKEAKYHLTIVKHKLNSIYLY